jgi:adenine-specific DNA-methyltransferase
MEELIADNRVWFGADGSNVPRLKGFRSEAREGLTPHTLWTHDEVGTTDSAKKELISLFEGIEVYDTPKPVSLIKRMVQISTSDTGNEIVLDFFAGSGTIGDAVVNLNHDDSGNRKFVAVQLPEPVPGDSGAKKAGYETISDVGKERIRRVIKKLNDADDGKLPLEGGQRPDRGFRVYKLAESNFAAWNADVLRDDTAALERQMELHVEHVREGRSEQDLLYEILLKSGFPLTAPVERVELAGSAVFSVAEGAMLVCLERKLTLEAIRVMAAQQPERVVCLDAGFAGNDPLKVNAVQLFKAKGIVFRTI